MTGHTEQPIRNTRRDAARGLGWWLGQLLLTGVAGFFVWFGIAVMVGAYGLGDPFSFIMTFFAASLIILISLVMVTAFILRMWRESRKSPPPEGPDATP